MKCQTILKSWHAQLKPFDIICVISIKDDLTRDYVDDLKCRQLGESLLTY